MEGRGWVVVARQELRDLWIGGRGLLLLFGFSILVSVITYVAATSEGINFLEKRETVKSAKGSVTLTSPPHPEDIALKLIKK